MTPILFALVTFFGWGIGDVFGAAATRRLGGYSTAFWDILFKIIFFSLYIPFAFNDLSRLTFETFLVILFLGIFWIVGLIAFYESLRMGNPSLVGTIIAAYAVLVVILSVIFLHERINPPQVYAILIIFFGLLLSSLPIDKLKNLKSIINKGITWAIIAMIFFGIFYTFIKIPVNQIGWFWPSFIPQLLAPLIWLYMKSKKIKLNNLNQQGGAKFLLVATFLTGVANFSFNFAVNNGLTAIVAPIAGAYPVLFVILAFLFFKDPISKQQILGIITTLTGIILLSLLSV